MNSRCFAAAASLLALTALAAAPTQADTPSPDGSVALKYKFVAGQVLRYHATADIAATTTAAGASIPTTSHVVTDTTQTVKSIDPATGDATLQAHTAPPAITMTVNGEPMNLPAAAGAADGIDATVVVSPIGKPVSFNVGGAAGAKMAGSGFNPSTLFSSGLGQYSAFPDHPVKVGDSWQAAIPMPQIGGTVSVKQTLVGLSTVGGHTIADIATSMSMDLDMTPPIPAAGAAEDAGGGPSLRVTGQQSGTGHERFDVDSGLIDSMSLSMKMQIGTTMASPSTSTSSASGAASSNPGAMTTHTDLTMTMHMDRAAG